MCAGILVYTAWQSLTRFNKADSSGGRLLKLSGLEVNKDVLLQGKNQGKEQ